MTCHALCRPWGGVSCTTVTSEGVSVSWTHGSGGLGVPPNGVVGDGTSCAKVNSGEGPSVESLESEDKIIVVARWLALKFESESNAIALVRLATLIEGLTLESLESESTLEPLESEDNIIALKFEFLTTRMSLRDSELNVIALGLELEEKIFTFVRCAAGFTAASSHIT